MKIHQYAILCAPIMGQEAAIEALERGEESMLKMRREYELRRNYIVRGFNDSGSNVSNLAARSTCFRKSLHRSDEPGIFPAAAAGKESRCGSRLAFGASGEGHVRCSYATALNQIKIAIERIAEFCSALA